MALPLARLLADTFDMALVTSYRSFALALASIVEARITHGAELLWRPALEALARRFGASWRHWAVVAAVGMLFRANRLQVKHGHASLFHDFLGRSTASGRRMGYESAAPLSSYARDAYEASLYRGRTSAPGVLTDPRTHGRCAAEVTLPDGSGTWYFVPSERKERRHEYEVEEQLSNPWKPTHPLMLTGPAEDDRGLAVRSRL
ncbi:hypothetical protein AB1Y20_010427 [Prymnesium parvum]|uniref:Uncharacterized protein n=1 Tax=Prymnesium parvum TaxID=97485 RepID=A0AB34IP95_PRYPA